MRKLLAQPVRFSTHCLMYVSCKLRCLLGSPGLLLRMASRCWGAHLLLRLAEALVCRVAGLLLLRHQPWHHERDLQAAQRCLALYLSQKTAKHSAEPTCRSVRWAR